jgi:hypothetical protein
MTERPANDIRFYSTVTPLTRDPKYENGKEQVTIDLWICTDGMFSYTSTYAFDDGAGNAGSRYKSLDGRYNFMTKEELGDRLELNVSSGVEQHTFKSNRTQYDVDPVRYEIVVEGGLSDPRSISAHELTAEQQLPLKL